MPVFKMPPGGASATPPKFILKGGKLACTCCDENAAPCTCPEDLPAEFALSSASGAFVDGDDCTGGETVNGPPVLSADPEVPCQWATPALTSYCWNGKRITFVGITLVDPGESQPCYWALSVHLSDGGEPVVWEGRKYTGLTPAGTYSTGYGDGDIATPATITVD